MNFTGSKRIREITEFSMKGISKEFGVIFGF